MRRSCDRADPGAPGQDRPTTHPLTAALAVSIALGTSAATALTPEEAAQAFLERGFGRVEVKSGPTQIKVEAVQGTTKSEVIYDRQSGVVLAEATGTAEAREAGRDGVTLRERSRDFIGTGWTGDRTADDEDRDEPRSRRDRGKRSDDRDHNGGDDHDDHKDDHGNDGHGDDDHGDGDHDSDGDSHDDIDE